MPLGRVAYFSTCYKLWAKNPFFEFEQENGFPYVREMQIYTFSAVLKICVLLQVQCVDSEVVSVQNRNQCSYGSLVQCIDSEAISVMLSV